MAGRATANSARRRGRGLKAVLFAALAIACATGAWALWRSLRGVCMSQSLLRDVARQVVISSPRSIPESIVLEMFGLRKGVNLAELDFAGKRAGILAKYPAIKTVSVKRLMPDRVEIAIEERIPVVRLGELDSRSRPAPRRSMRVADSGGTVFVKAVDVSALPAIYESAARAAKPGERLSGMPLAALRLLTLCREKPYSSLGILRIDANRRDWLLAVLGDFSQAKIAWDGMESDSPASAANMKRLVGRLCDCVSSGVAAPASATMRPVMWNATLPDRIFADTREPIR